MNIWNWWAFGAACAWIVFGVVTSPVYVAVVLSQSGYGVGVGYIVHSRAIRRAQLYAAGIQKKKNKAKRKIRREIATYLFKRVRIERIFLFGVVSFEDAMKTALVWGTLHALSQVKPLRIQNKTSANFALGHTNLEATGILSVPAGHIMIAAFKHALIAIRERFDLWTNTRSKA